MRKLSKKILAILCCIAIVFTGISVENFRNNEVQAAGETPKSTISLTTGQYGFKRKSAGGPGHVNITYAGVASDYKNNGQNFMDKTFSDKYVTYGGGMTYDDLVEGIVSFYIATNSILQLNWESRTTTFAEGWSFTIAQGALLPYRNANGVAYMALDKEYTFTFKEGNSDNDNILEVVGYYTTTFSLGNMTLWGNGTGSATSQFSFADSNVANFNTIYKEIQADQTYADYIQLANYDYSELADKNVVLKYILDGGARCIQVTNWGSLRQDMKQGDRIVFKEGLPIYYVGTNGQNYKATLDATYAYECQGSNSDNTQIFLGTKVSADTQYGLNTMGTAITTSAQSATNPEQYINVGFDANSTNKISHSVNVSVLEQANVSDYVKIADYTVEEAIDMGIVFRFIPNANVLQIGFGEQAVDALEAGDLIYLKKGMTVLYNIGGTLHNAALDADYCFEITDNNGTNLSIRWYLSDEFSVITDTIGQSGPEAGYKFYGVTIQPDKFEDAASRGEGSYNDAIMTNYISLSKHDADDMIADGSWLKWYTYLPTVFQGLRLYSNLSFVDGEVMFLKAGLPVEYTTTSGKLKAARLDKNYGFVYSASAKTFTYDSSLVLDDDKEAVVESFGFDTETMTSKTEGGNQVINVPITGAPFTFTDYYYVGLQDTVAEFIDDSACENVNMLFVLASEDVQVLQLQLTPDMVSSLEVGDRILLKKGMPVAYSAATPEAKATLDGDYAIRVIEKNGEAITVQVELTGTYSLTDVFYHNSEYMDVQYGSSNDLSDAAPFEGVNLGAAVMKDYLEIYDQSYDDLVDKGYGLQAFAIPALRGIRINFTDFDLKEGDILLFKKGLPITYTTTSGKAKTVYLDDTYGYIKNAETAFVYDATVKEIKDPVISYIGLNHEAGFYTEQGDNSLRVNIPFIDGALETNGYLCPDIMTKTDVQPYIQVGDYTTAQLLAGGFKILFIPSAGVFQMIPGDIEVEVGMEITFKEGMTISYFDNGPKKAIIKQDYPYEVVDVNGTKVLQKVNYYTVSVTVDGSDCLNGKYKEGTEIDLSSYEDTQKGAVMSVKVNGIALEGMTYVVSENAEIVIENRSDICVVIFRDNGETCAVREYLITDKNVQLPYAPDKDGYDDSWEAFELVNGTIYVDAVHTAKQTHPVVKLSGIEVEDTDHATGNNNAQDNGASESPKTGDVASYGGWLLSGVMAMAFVVLALAKKNKTTIDK